MELPPIAAKRKTGQEFFSYNQRPQKVTLLDFWQWSASDLVSNVTRGVLAEFIVAMALNQNMNIRSEWDAYDFITKDGIKVEVKSASYVQSWYQKDFSKIVFSIRPTKAWSSQTNRQAKEQKRQADIYVFALLDHLDQRTIDPLNLNQWSFLVISTQKLQKELPTAKSISLQKLKSLNPVVCSYKRLNRYVHDVYQSASSSSV